MRKLTFRLLLLGCLMAATAQAQQAVPPPKTEFLDSDFQVVASASQASYRRETAYTDSVGGTVRDYLLDAKPVSIAHYSHIRRKVRHGTTESWYPNGQLKWHEEYAEGKQHGEQVLYYESGQLKRRETFAADQRLSGECFGPTGAVVPFFDYLVLPHYAEGNGDSGAIVQAIARRVKYPVAARRAQVQGRVLVSFVVNSQGSVTDVRIVQGLSSALDASVIHAVRRLRRFEPGRRDGEQVAISYTLPVVFQLQD